MKALIYICFTLFSLAAVTIGISSESIAPPHEAYIKFLSDSEVSVNDMAGAIKIKASKLNNGSGRVSFRVEEPMRVYGVTSIIRGKGVFQPTEDRWTVDYVLFPRSSYTATMSHPDPILRWDYNINLWQPNIGTRVWVTGPADVTFVEGSFEVIVGGVETTFDVCPGSPITIELQ